MSYTKYIQAINDLLVQYNLDLSVTEEDIAFGPSIVTDEFTEGIITDHLTRAISPPIHNGEFYHYTKFSGSL